MRIYTRTGDQGETGLGSGARARKSSARVVALGEVDEANACIGLARAWLEDEPELDLILDGVQHRLFDLGADLAAPQGARRVGAAQTEALELQIDRLERELEPLRAFILPGGERGAAALHVARTVCRRAERALTALIDAGEADEPQALAFLNRLSDLLFVASRYANRRRGDVLWRVGDLA